MHLPVLKSIEIDNRVFSVTFIRQYTNSSLVNFNIDWDTTNDSTSYRAPQSHFELYLGNQYDCRMVRAAGSEGHFSYNFVVSPPLIDNISGLDLIFKEYNRSSSDKPIGVDIVIHVD